MATNVSAHLKQLQERAADATPVKLHVHLGGDLSDDAVQHLLQSLQRIGKRLEFLERQKTVILQTEVGAVDQIAHLPGVFWIDVDKEAPLESLLDRPDD